MKRYLHPHVHCNIISNNQDMETTSVSTDGRMNQENGARVLNGICLCHKKSEILPSETTGTDLEGIMLSDISQTEKDKDHKISLIVGSKNKTDRDREQTGACQRPGLGDGQNG